MRTATFTGITFSDMMDTDGDNEKENFAWLTASRLP
jgi:hypothetical protein